MKEHPTAVTRLVLAGVLATAVVSAGVLIDRSVAAQTYIRSGIVVTVDAGSTAAVIPRGFFGINADGFWDPAVTSKTSARALAQTPIETVRFPGGAPADWYDWQNPSYAGRSHTSPLNIWTYARSFKAVQLVFGTNYQGHVDRTGGKAPAVNSPESAAAWVAYDRAKRIQADMEVGNEEDMNLMHKQDDPAFNAYISAFNAQAKAMHRANPHVHVLGPAGTNEWYWWGLDGLGLFLKGAGNRTGTGQVDGVSLHFYSGKSWGDTQGMAQYWLSSNGPWSNIRRMIHEHDTRNLPVYITEWNVGGSNNSNSFAPTIGHALVTADVLGAFATSGVAGEDYFDTHGANTWGLLYSAADRRPLDSPTPTYYAMVLWRHMGRHLVRTTQNTDAAKTVSAYATRMGQSVQVLLINKQSSMRRVTIVLRGVAGRRRTPYIYSLTPLGGRIDARDVRYDGTTMPSPQRALPGPKRGAKMTGNPVTYAVPGYSAVVLDLR